MPWARSIFLYLHFLIQSVHQFIWIYYSKGYLKHIIMINLFDMVKSQCTFHAFYRQGIFLRICISVVLTYCDLVARHGGKTQGQHLQWLVVWRHQRITCANVNFSSASVSGVHLRAIWQQMTSYYSASWYHFLLEILTNRPGSNELTRTNW